MKICFTLLFSAALTIAAAAAPTIRNPLYPTEDIVIADYVVTAAPYNADPTGVANSTVAIQNAIDACYTSGRGGTVYIPAGTYLVTGTIKVSSFVTLRGDWRDPDSGSGSYGTVIKAALAAGDNGPVLFQIGGSAGVMGITTFYPNQNSTTPVHYNYTFSVPSSSWVGMAGTYSASSIINCTMLNSFRGIGINALDNTKVHDVSTVKNVKGTVLYRGAVAYNSADVGIWENITFKNSYWANAGVAYNAPSLTALNTWTRANGVAFTFGDLEWDQFFRLTCSDYKWGINIVPGSRVAFCGQFLFANIQNTTIAVKVDAIDTRWGMSFLRSVLTGSSYSIWNNTAGYVKTCDSTVTGTRFGIVNETAPGTTAASYPQATYPKVTRSVLYNAAIAPYNAPHSVPHTGLPAADATAAIQSALNAAGNAGGGVVYLPSGWYRINTHLTVPANVELRGSSSVPTKDQPGSSLGTVLLGYEGRATAAPLTATALVTLNGATAGIRGIRFFYPNNNPADAVVEAFPFTIRGKAASNYVVNVALTGVYNGVDFANANCDLHVIRRVVGVAYSHFIMVAGTAGGWVEGNLSNPAAVTRQNILVSPNWLAEVNLFSQVINPITRPNEILILLNSVANEHVLNNFGYGVFVGVNAAFCNVNLFNLGCDNLGSGGYCAGGDTCFLGLHNVMKYGGAFFSVINGSVTPYNPMALP
ncbi:MAG: glycosyl hydrolase family 28-related protein [Prosthecobacter sp.]